MPKSKSHAHNHAKQNQKVNVVVNLDKSRRRRRLSSGVKYSGAKYSQPSHNVVVTLAPPQAPQHVFHYQPDRPQTLVPAAHQETPQNVANPEALRENRIRHFDEQSLSSLGSAVGSQRSDAGFGDIYPQELQEFLRGQNPIYDYDDEEDEAQEDYEREFETAPVSSNEMGFNNTHNNNGFQAASGGGGTNTVATQESESSQMKEAINKHEEEVAQIHERLRQHIEGGTQTTPGIAAGGGRRRQGDEPLDPNRLFQGDYGSTAAGKLRERPTRKQENAMLRAQNKKAGGGGGP